MKKYISDNEVLMSEWDYEHNSEIDPKLLSVGSNKKVWWRCLKCKGKWQTAISDRTRKNCTGCPYCAGQKVLRGYNDLATKYPEIIRQWNVEKNGIITPSDVIAGSSKNAWWICEKGHEFEQKISARVKHISSCPVCSGQKVLNGADDLASRYPEVAQEWNYAKNCDMTPNNITWGSNKKVWWKCSKCCHEWQARIFDRTKDNNGCPVCGNRTLAIGINDLASKFSEVAKEWHPTKNGSLTPKDVKATENKKVWWRCSKGHDFFQSINLRTTRNNNCPVCSNHTILVGFNDLAATYPKIAEEWHPTKNGNLTPNKVVAGSRQKVWWICKKGHEFEQSIYHRTTRGQSCPYCSGQKVRKDLNDFETKYPATAKEWHPTKNGDLKPSDVTFGSGQKVWWKCPIGHEYQAVVRDRGKGGGCPICSAKNFTSFPEQAIFYYTRQLYPDALNRYSECFDNSMELDIYIPSLKIAIEYDGAAWHKTEEHHEREIKKYNICKNNEIYLIRIKERSDIIWNDVADRIYYLPKIKRNNIHALEKVITVVLKQITANGSDICIDIEKDKYDILNYVCKVTNSLLEQRPDVAEKWNYEKNGYLKPDMFSTGSNEVVWWKCLDCGHEWECSINNMTRDGRYGCAICSKKRRGKSFTQGVVQRVGSLAETIPELAKEWHPIKNGDLTPQDITAGRFKPVWWLCPKCGHEWQASPNNRKKGSGCPCCSGRVPKIGVNDLKTLYPEIAKEWHPEKNGELIPSTFKPSSTRKVWWKCPNCGNEYEASIGHRTSGTSCPKCAIERVNQSKQKAVNMINPQTDAVIRTFNSVTEASQEMKINGSNISMVCRGERPLAGGYKWEYVKQKPIQMSLELPFCEV